MHVVELRTNEKILLITLGGLMSYKESHECIDELNTLIKCINPANYNIVVNADKLRGTNDIIEQSLELIINTPFKKRFSIMPEDDIIKTQVNRITNNKICNVIIAESYKEVLDSIA